MMDSNSVLWEGNVRVNPDSILKILSSNISFVNWHKAICFKDYARN